jgi:hypothetical protein
MPGLDSASSGCPLGGCATQKHVLTPVSVQVRRCRLRTNWVMCVREPGRYALRRGGGHARPLLGFGGIHVLAILLSFEAGSSRYTEQHTPLQADISRVLVAGSHSTSTESASTAPASTTCSRRRAKGVNARYRARWSDAVCGGLFEPRQHTACAWRATPRLGRLVRAELLPAPALARCTHSDRLRVRSVGDSR